MAAAEQNFDLIIIGGGPAGVTAALRARELGAKTAIIERAIMGGTCTNDGCAPTRVLARAARLMRDARQFAEYGLIAEPPTIDFAQVIDRTQQVVYQLQEKKQLIAHLTDVGVEALYGVGSARFTDPHTVSLPDGRSLRAEKFVISAGGSAKRLPFPGSEFTLTHSDVWTLKKLPASVAIIGAGATGCQLGSVFSAFGARVTIMDAAQRILMTEDESVAEQVKRSFTRHGIEMIIGIKGVEKVEKREDGLTLTYTLDGKPETLDVEAVVVAVGWPGNTPDLGLDKAGVEVERSYIKTDDYLRTTAPNIYAAGDITGRIMLVQTASYQARVAAENALIADGKSDRPAQSRLVPHGGFTDPEYGGVGMTEAQAREGGRDVVVAHVPYADLDRAVIDGYTEGFCKLIVQRDSHLILGAHVVGEQAVEVVQLIATGMAAGMKVEQLADVELAYPTYAAIVGLAARELIRKLGFITISQEWLALNPIRGVEWERKDM